MPAKKVGTQLLVSPHIRARGQALAVVRQESVAEVWRIALEGGGLPAMESAQAPQLAKLYDILDRMNVDREEALEAMTQQKMSVGDLLLADGTPRARFPGRISQT